jgi:cytochrome c
MEVIRRGFCTSGMRISLQDVIRFMSSPVPFRNRTVYAIGGTLPRFEARTYAYPHQPVGSAEYDFAINTKSANKSMELSMKPQAYLPLFSVLLLPCVVGISASRADEPVGFQAGLWLAEKNNCQQCHAPYETLAGPSFHDIAKRYASDPHARNDLGTRILNGSMGAWGPTPMPPAPVSKEDLRPLVNWILSQTN